jgi:hypothetical protein
MRLRHAVTLVSAAALTALRAGAQSAGAGVAVYLPEFRSSGGQLGAAIARYAQEAIRFELLQLPQVGALHSESSGCAAAGSGSALRAVAQKSAPGVSGRAISVSGTVDGVEKDSTFTIEVELISCPSPAPGVVFHEERALKVRTVSAELRALASLVRASVREQLLPKARMVVSGFTPGAAPPRALDAALRRWPDEAAATGETQPAADSAVADFVVRVSPSSSTPSFPRAYVKISAGTRQVDSMAVERQAAPDSLFAGTIAHRAAGRVAELARVPGLASGQTLATLPRDSAIRIARRALCLDDSANCRRAPDLAFAVVSSAARSMDPDLLAIRGRAELLRGNVGEALTSLTRALNLSPAERTRPPAIPESQPKALHSTIAEAYRQAGNSSGALREYEWLLGNGGLDSIATFGFVQSLHLANRPLDALRAAADGLQSFRTYDVLRAEAGRALRDVEARRLADTLAFVDAQCRRDAGLRAACGTAIAEQGIAFNAQGLPVADVERVLNAAFALGVSDQLRAEGATAIAAAYVGGGDLFVGFDGAATMGSERSRPEMADRYMTMVAGIRGVAIRTQEWGLRVRALSAAIRKDYGRSLAIADSAFDRMATSEAAVLYAQIAFVFRYQASPRAPDSVTMVVRRARALLDSAERRFPSNAALRQQREFFCSEAQLDPVCAFQAGRQRVTNGDLVSAADYLDPVENAVVADSISLAVEWLRKAPGDKLSGCELAVQGLYSYWAAVQQNRGPDASAAMGRWRQGVEQYRAEKPKGKCWIFSGATQRLMRSPQPRNASTLQMMIRAIDDPASPLPPAAPAIP